MKNVERAREILGIERDGLERVMEGLDMEFSRSVDLLLDRLQQGGRVVLTGMGKSFHVAQKIAATMNSTGTPAVVLHPTEAMHGDLGILNDPDVALALSYSGASEELIALLPVIKRRHLPIVALTGVPDSPLAANSNEIIPITVDREACPFNMAPTTSTTVMMAVGDALAMVLLESRGFKKEDYARLHPGGAIGRTLLLRVSDIMRRDDRVASVPSGSTVKDAVLAMSAARSGSVAVIDDRHRVIGVFTDGDFRRHFEALADLGGRPIDEVMTPDPVTVNAEALAVDVLDVFKTHNIDDLLVVDAEGRLAGLIDIQDLPKLKIL